MANAGSILERIRAASTEWTNSPRDYDALIERAAATRCVLIGEASHGTHEFYRDRAEITKRLITERGFNAVAVEADWPDAYRINRFVRDENDDEEPIEALADFTRFPTWMWRNADVLDFVGWLRESNDRIGNAGEKCGFYGIDLYSLFTSIEAVLTYLEKVDPDAARRARFRYSCFDHYGEDSQAYGYATTFGMTQPCEDAVVAQLSEMQRRAGDYARRDGHIPPDELFFAEQNARLVKNAERYYRSMFSGRVSSWNLRDQHMGETVEQLFAHLERQGRVPRVVIWAHNSHLGDARATQMGRDGELNVGQLMRQRFGSDAYLIGFSTFTGTVTAADDWDAPAQRKKVNPGLPDSYESLFHAVGNDGFVLDLHDPRVANDLSVERLQRAIGVIYRPDTERLSHYFYASVARQFDTMIHIDTTRAVEPLERRAKDHHEPETYPSAL